MKFDRDEYHPDRMLGRSGDWYEWCAKHWGEATRGIKIETVNDFRHALMAYCSTVGPVRERVHEQVRRDADEDMMSPAEMYAQYLADPGLAKVVKIGLAQYQVVMDWLVDRYSLINYGQLYTHPFFREVVVAEEADVGPQNMKSEYILRHAVKAYQAFGRKMYFVSPGLEQELRNTSVRGMPEEFFRLPYQAVYLVCPRQDPFRIYHEADGWHDVEGLYLVEDQSSHPKTMRVIVMGKPNENAKFADDDAFYHWTLYLREGKTIDECLDESFGVGDGELTITRAIDGSKTRIVSGNDTTERGRQVFAKNRPQLDKIFRYALNVLLYATHPDAECRGFNTSADYESLRQRAMKAKGKKRKTLFERAKKSRGRDRLLLGGSIWVSRRDEASGEGSRKGSKHTVRTYVQGHWQHFWVGPRDGERKRIYKRKRPYWKGPKDGQLSSKVHVLG